MTVLEDDETIKKRVSKIEVQCLLHTQCNLRCKFCFETKEKGIRENSNINIDYIKKLPNEVMDVVLPRTLNSNISQIEISMMGGELFSDNISDDIFDVYREFAHDIKNKLHKERPDIECKFKCLTNGVYTKHSRIEEFLKEFNARIILSYDPIDRFTNDTQKEIWFKTFEYFYDRKEYSLTVSAVLTKRTISSYINGDDIFNNIPNNILVDSNIYVPRLDYEEYLPNDDDIYNFYKWCIDNNKFNVSHVQNILLSHFHGVILPSCGSNRADYMFGEDFIDKYGSKWINKCTEESPISKDEYYGENSKSILDATNCSKYKQPIGLQKRGCLYCQYYSKCPKMCWTQILFDKYQITQCPIQRVYEYIDNSRDIMNRFEKWRKSL